jgi:aspartate kinase
MLEIQHFLPCDFLLLLLLINLAHVLDSICVYKFGGASVKDAAAVNNLAEILSQGSSGKKVVIVSAMGKTTNALEKVVEASYRASSFESEIQQVRNYHLEIIKDLFVGETLDRVKEEIDTYCSSISAYCKQMNRSNFNKDYDFIVGHGELLSTRVIFHFLLQEGIKTHWEDARILVKTNDLYREALVNWDLTRQAISSKAQQAFQDADILLSQGFIGSDIHGYPTTLGREGSDFTGAIFAHALDAHSLTIWKDVPGLLNADPKIFAQTEQINQISYGETVELAYYGASIIHPKTIKPLQNKKIPLFVRSFVDLKHAGSTISKDNSADQKQPSFIVKQDQVLMSISPRDYSFMNEDHLAKIFALFARLHIKINVMQNSAISFSACMDDIPEKIEALIKEMRVDYKIRYNRGLRLMTIRHYTPESITRITNCSIVLLEQRSRSTIQLVMEQIEDSLWIE